MVTNTADHVLKSGNVIVQLDRTAKYEHDFQLIVYVFRGMVLVVVVLPTLIPVFQFLLWNMLC